MKKYIFYLLSSILLITSCSKEEPINPVTSFSNDKEYLKELMSQWYLWNEELPAQINTNAYSDQFSMLQALRNEQDRWSLIQDKAAYEAYYQSGTVTDENSGAHGIYLSVFENGDLYLRFSYPGSEAFEKGLTRGTKINKINGVDVNTVSDEELNNLLGENVKGVTNTFEITIPERYVYDDEGVLVKKEEETKTVDITKEAVVIAPVVHKNIINVKRDGQVVKVGHIVFMSFIETAEEALNTAFAEFKAAGVSEVILDLRYNGGGRVNIAGQLSGLLAPASANGKDLFRYRHNALQVEQNSDYKLELEDANLNLDRVFMLTTGGTASASELMINALRPFMDVQVVGERTHGKPVGSYGFENNDFIYSVISLRILNADNEGDYFDGIPVNQEAFDDPTYNWEDTREPMLYQALQMIMNGAYDAGNAARMGHPTLKNMADHADKYKDVFIVDQINE
ncbi:hypothetical protein KMW28_09455 [Flammeovirga yaeyamensis]|uniref:Tail specific protease domain-containing protein n=1 Tax=Flammeovirga yaeyamensis TaxID=367791 RepID=A0AAX1NCG3_9BACT|nr:S41 family peptidase [Flammeovirga yaeyamensis]MBB3698814.1 C-terminal processing protease CtpA/Prc [Flammeovirga yaeyamensis]NMF37399.1 hypothetical protein [Flammeovirga yaeyamensis]QWG03787.1 hypothetical protein KMW28_09455 [Flammeovirga yaeyamensis]